MLEQLVQDRPTISNDVKSLYDRHTVNHTRPAHDEFVNALRSEIAKYSKVLVIVDALGEFLERDREGHRVFGAKKLRPYKAPKDVK